MAILPLIVENFNSHSCEDKPTTYLHLHRKVIFETIFWPSQRTLTFHYRQDYNPINCGQPMLQAVSLNELFHNKTKYSCNFLMVWLSSKAIQCIDIGVPGKIPRIGKLICPYIASWGSFEVITLNPTLVPWSGMIKEIWHFFKRFSIIKSYELMIIPSLISDERKSWLGQPLISWIMGYLIHYCV